MTAQDVKQTGEELREQLRPLAARYLWWKPVQEALRYPERVIAQVMDLGTFDDMQLLDRLLGEEALIRVLRRAEAGQFSARSWHYWHYRLGLSEPGQVPRLPVRKTA